MAKFTPGPWHFYRCTDKDCLQGPHYDIFAREFTNKDGEWCGTGVADVPAHMTDPEFNIANAHLIAAAPDLHDELSKSNGLLWDILNYLDDFPMVRQRINEQRQLNANALAKAEGRQ